MKDTKKEIDKIDVSVSKSKDVLGYLFGIYLKNVGKVLYYW